MSRRIITLSRKNNGFGCDSLFETRNSDIRAVLERDPAARSQWEVRFLYSGYKEIGKGLFIDHGMGVVIGETTIIGDNCTIYQNVTLGGTGKDTGKRHPTLGNNVLVGSGAKVLGPFKVGDNARIAAGAVVLSEIPPNSTAVGVPARVVKVNGIRSETLDQIHISDPVAQALCKLQYRIEELEKQIQELKSKE